MKPIAVKTYVVKITKSIKVPRMNATLPNVNAYNTIINKINPTIILK